MERYEQAVRQWQDWNVQTVADIDQYLDNFRILFAYHSGKIENAEITYHDTREIFENGKVIGYTGSPRALFEQQNQKLCYEVLKEKIAAKEEISVELIQEIHRVLTGGTYDERRYIDRGERPGEFKKHDYVTGIHEVGSAPEEVESDLRELIAEVNEVGKKKPLKAGAYLHAQFEYTGTPFGILLPAVFALSGAAFSLPRVFFQSSVQSHLCDIPRHSRAPGQDGIFPAKS